MIKQSISNALARAGKLGKALAVLVLLAGIAYGGVSGYCWYKNRIWPSFPTVEDKTDVTPQAQVAIDRDYAYRTGDLIHMQLYIKQMPGTTVDWQTLSINDTFEAAAKPAMKMRKFADGSVVYRIDLTVQSFMVARDLTFGGTVAWKNGDQRADLAIPEKHVYTSNTYDGRKNLMEGGDPRVSLYWYGARYVLPLLLASVIYLLFFVPSFKAWLRSLVKPVVIDHARNRVVELLASIQDGTCSKEQHLELDGLVRERFHVGSVPVSQLEIALVPPSVIVFLKLNEPAIYSPDLMDDKTRAQLLAKSHVLLSHWK